jgi:hypothetical protein
LSLVIDTGAEGRNCLSLIRILIDGDNLLICQDLNGLIARVAEIGSDQEMGLEECPRGKMSLFESSVDYAWI